MIGRTLSHYKVLEKIGEGGMGEVYLAKDTKLDREVAVKVLPTAFSENKERLARFEREARLLASLNHPNIAAIHELEESDGVHFLALEYVPGETLAERINRGAIPIDEALLLFKQIAEGLEAAHGKGVIHRDLKPANIKVTPEGKAKVLDFGLAKALQDETPDVDSSQSPTLTKGTALGTIMGTAAYMSPEQARGKPVDRRTDIWAFGCCFYEALTGKTAFLGETVSDTVAAVLTKEPDWQALPDTTPISVRSLLRRCSQKDLKRRVHDVADVRIEIEETIEEPTLSTGMSAIPAGLEWGARSLRWTAAVIFAVLASLVIGIFVGMRIRNFTVESHRHGRYTINLPADAPAEIFDNPTLAISPDGSRLVYVAKRDDTTELYLRELDRFESKPIPGTENARGPFFSPDGEWVGYFDYATRELKKAFIDSGTSMTICDTPNVHRGASWASDDTIVFAYTVSGLYRVPANGGVPQPLTTVNSDKGEKTHRWPEALPGGHAFLFMIGTSQISSYDEASIAVVSVDTGEVKVLLEGGSNPRYVPTGQLIYARAGSLMAVPFDVERLEVTGLPVRLLDGLVTSDGYGSAQFSFSQEGTLTYVAGGPEAYYSDMLCIDQKGIISPPLARHGFYGARFSPDERFLAVEVLAANNDVWLYEFERGSLSRLTTEWENRAPIWTPDGRLVTYLQSGKDAYSICWQSKDRSTPEEKLITSEYEIFPESWSPDGKLLAYTEFHPGTRADIRLLAAQDDRTLDCFLCTPFNERGAAFSPDGFWIAYDSDETGRYEVYVQAFPGPGGKWQISTNGGTAPVWGRSGRELYYRDGDRMMAVSIETEPEFSPAVPRMLFEFEAPTQSTWRTFDVAPSGNRFVMIGPETAPTSAVISVVLNWFEELKRLVPTN